MSFITTIRDFSTAYVEGTIEAVGEKTIEILLERRKEILNLPQLIQTYGERTVMLGEFATEYNKIKLTELTDKINTALNTEKSLLEENKNTCGKSYLSWLTSLACIVSGIAVATFVSLSIGVSLGLAGAAIFYYGNLFTPTIAEILDATDKSLEELVVPVKGWLNVADAQSKLTPDFKKIEEIVNKIMA